MPSQKANALQSLQAGKDMIFYPSGHVALVPREVIGNRRLAYEVCPKIPDETEIILVRITGLEDSIWSKQKTKRLRLRRKVKIECVEMTAEVKQWATSLDRRSFNQRLEEWYNHKEDRTE